MPCYKRIPEASQWPDKSAGASLSICLRGMSAGKRPDTENLFSQCANLTDEIPCWSYSTRTGMDKLPLALSMCLYVVLTRPLEGHFLLDSTVNLNGRVADIDKMQVSPKRNLLCDTDAVSTRLTPYDPQCEQKLFCLVSFITVWRSLPHSSVQVAEWQSGRTDHVCVKMQQLSLSFSLFLSLICLPLFALAFPVQTDRCVSVFGHYLKVVG